MEGAAGICGKGRVRKVSEGVWFFSFFSLSAEGENIRRSCVEQEQVQCYLGGIGQ